MALFFVITMSVCLYHTGIVKTKLSHSNLFTKNKTFNRPLQQTQKLSGNRLPQNSEVNLQFT